MEDVGIDERIVADLRDVEMHVGAGVAIETNLFVAARQRRHKRNRRAFGPRLQMRHIDAFGVDCGAQPFAERIVADRAPKLGPCAQTLQTNRDVGGRAAGRFDPIDRRANRRIGRSRNHVDEKFTVGDNFHCC